MKCEACATSELGFCFDHIPVSIHPDNPLSSGDKIKADLWNMLNKVIHHEGAKWVHAPCPYDVAGCAFCGKTQKDHDADCIILHAQDLLNETKIAIGLSK